MIKQIGYIINCIQYKDYDLICELLTKNGVITFLNKSGLKNNNKLNCNCYKLSYVEVDLYKGNQKYYKIKDLKVLKYCDIIDSNFEKNAFYNFIIEILSNHLKYDYFDYVIFDELDKIINLLNSNSYNYSNIIMFYGCLLKRNGIINITKNLELAKNEFVNIFNYFKLERYLNLINDRNVFKIIENTNLLDKDVFIECFKILTLIYESAFNINLRSKDLIYII